MGFGIRYAGKCAGPKLLDLHCPVISRSLPGQQALGLKEAFEGEAVELIAALEGLWPLTHAAEPTANRTLQSALVDVDSIEIFDESWRSQGPGGELP